MANINISPNALRCVVLVVLAVSYVTGLSNVYCRIPVETVIPIDPINHGYFPYYVKLHRCAGSNGFVSPSVQKCVAVSYKEFPLTVHSISSAEAKTVMLTNHTICQAQCVSSPSECDPEVHTWNEKTCSCKCRYPDGPPEHKKCKDGFGWNSHQCQCTCRRPPAICPIRQVWSTEACGCVCENRAVRRCARKRMGLDIDDCSCVDVQASGNRPGVHPQSRMFITILAGQGVLIIILICVLVHWIRKKRQPNPSDTVERLDSYKSEDESPPKYSEVPAKGSSESLDSNSKDFDDSSCTVPLSPKVQTTDI